MTIVSVNHDECVVLCTRIIGNVGSLWIACASVEYVSTALLVCVTQTVLPMPIGVSYYLQPLQV